jgi:2-dehydropantoate 2-reductase
MDALTIVGAGGIGCAVGYALRRAGHRVTFVEADRDKVAWGRRHGVQLAGSPPLPADFVPFDDWQPAPDDLILLCTKCYDNAIVLDRLSRANPLIPIQNGFDRLLEAHGHALEGIASFVSECDAGRPVTRLTRNGKLHLGYRGTAHRFDPGADQRLDALAAALRRHAPFRVEVVPDVLPYKHTKLMYNAAISPLAAAAGLDNGRLLSVRPARRLFFALLKENYAILEGAGVPLGKVGPLEPATVARILARPLVAHAFAWAFYPSLRGSYCSMSGDLPKGRTEIDYYNRHLIDLAADRPCPLNRRVYDMVRRMEETRRPPALAVLDELAA